MSTQDWAENVANELLRDHPASMSTSVLRLKIAKALREARSEPWEPDAAIRALKHIQAMAGIPDASEACRNIIRRAQEAIDELRK